jgi:hypothetical protein
MPLLLDYIQLAFLAGCCWRHDRELSQNTAHCYRVRHAVLWYRLLQRYQERVQRGDEQGSVIFTAVSEDPIARDRERQRCISTSDYKQQLLDKADAAENVNPGESVPMPGQHVELPQHPVQLVKPAAGSGIAARAKSTAYQVCGTDRGSLLRSTLTPSGAPTMASVAWPVCRLQTTPV